MNGAQTHQVRRTVLGARDGAAALLLGARFVWDHRRKLAVLFLPPMAICLVVVVTAVVLITHAVPSLVDTFWTEPQPEAWWGAKHALWRFFEIPVTLLLGLVGILGTIFVALLLFSLLTAAFCDALSERVEVLRGTFEPRPFSWSFLLRDVLESLRLELVRLGVKVAWLLPLFLASLFIPVIGPVAYVVVGGYILASRTGMDYIDWCGARRGWDHRERLAFAKKHKPAMLGFGAAVLATWTIPLAFVILWPAAVAGGAILFNELEEESRGLCLSKSQPDQG